MLRVLLVAIFLNALWVSAAEAGDRDKGKAKVELLAGDEALADGDALVARRKVDAAVIAYKKALKHYQKAYSLFSSDQILFPIAVTEQRLGRFVDALNHYDLALESKELSEQQRKKVRQGISEVRANLAMVEFDVAPKHASIILDGVEIGKGTVTQYVMPGTHNFEIRGDEDFEAGTLELKPGDRKKISKDLGGTAVEHDREEIRLPDEFPKKSTPGRSTGVLWIGGAITGVFLGAGTGLGVAAWRQQQVFENPVATPDQMERAKDNGKKLALAADVSFGLAAATVLVSAYLYLSDDPDDGGQARLEVSPTLGPEMTGVVFESRF